MGGKNPDNTEGMWVGEGVVGGGRGRDGYSEFFTNETTVSTKMKRQFPPKYLDSSKDLIWKIDKLLKG